MRRFVTLLIMGVIILTGCSTDPENKVVVTLVDEQQPVGHYTVLWGQANQKGNQVPAGAYVAHLTAGSFDSSIAFQIRKDAPHHPDVTCDTAGLPHGSLVDAISLSPTLYALGDTVCIAYSLLETKRVVMRIEQ